MKKIFAIFLVLALVLTVIPTNAQALNDDMDSEIIMFADGSYMVVTVEQWSAKAESTTNGHKTYSLYDSGDNLDWQATLNATFYYNGLTSVCGYGECTVTIYDNAWYVRSNFTGLSGGTATTNLEMGRKLLGVTIAKPQFTITLTCDKYGNLS